MINPKMNGKDFLTSDEKFANIDKQNFFLLYFFTFGFVEIMQFAE